MKRFGLYAACTLILILVSALLLGLGFRGPGDAAAVRLSAVVAALLQIAAFPLVRRLSLGPGRMVVGWGVGALLRFVTLVVYGILVIKVFAVAPAAALVAMATFLFLTTLIEPLFLGR